MGRLATDTFNSGCLIAWCLVNADLGTVPQENSRFYSSIYGLGDWHRAGNRRAFPMRVGSLSDVQKALRNQPMSLAATAEFSSRWAHKAWTYAAVFAGNFLFGARGPVAEGSWTAAEKRAVEAIGKGVSRFLGNGRVESPVDDNFVQTLRSKKMNYRGEEVGTCHRLTLKQVLPSLPPKEHGGSINAVDWVSKHTRFLLENPSLSILPDDGRELPRLRGIIHADKDEMDSIADELVDRGVCDWIPLATVQTYRSCPVLNGLFGVAKAQRVGEQPVLRLIMNLVGSNAILRQFQGATKNLPSITSWMSTVVTDHEEISFWQSDMCNAFYLFNIPHDWKKLLAFNVLRKMWDNNSQSYTTMALSCRVLPMGWLSSVAIMQEISEGILRRRHLDPSAQLLRQKAVPPWMVGILDESRRTNKLWWHIYLDNFAAGQVFDDPQDIKHGIALHELAELAWSEAGVLSSAKKRKSSTTIVEELGAFVNGTNGYLGGSPERFTKLVQATCWLLSQPMLSKKLVQVVAGRWIHVMQFRRPTMSFLDETWAFLGQKKLAQGVHAKVRREFLACLCIIPLMHTDLKTQVSSAITASDASSTGGAVGIARTLTPQGAAFTKVSGLRAMDDGHIPVLVLSLFGGIGGAFRAYDLLGLKPAGLVHFDIHDPSNRVVSRRWPAAEIHLDVKTLNEALIHDWLSRYLNIEEIHLWAGFPCTGLSSANALGAGLAGPSSSLFWEVLRIRGLLHQVVPSHIKIKSITENVASMKASEEQQITQELGCKPYHLDPADAVPMHRPRLCWCSEPLEGSLDELTFTPEQRWTRVTAKADYPQHSQWVEPQHRWPGGEEGWVLPTCMKAIARSKPPFRPAGIERCSWEALQRYQADGFRYPPYQYQNQYIFYSDSGQWRTASAEEKELLLGYGWKHTYLCYNASKIKQNFQQYDDERHSLLGDSFSLYSFVIPAAAVCKRFLPNLSYKFLALRMGIAPGFRSPIRLLSPLARHAPGNHSRGRTA